MPKSKSDIYSVSNEHRRVIPDETKLDEKNRKTSVKLLILLIMIVVLFLSIVLAVSIGSVKVPFGKVIYYLFKSDDSDYSFIVRTLRLPRVLTGALVGVALSLSGAILKGVMRNELASPTTIGVTAGASFMAHVFVILFPALAYLLPFGAFIGAFGTTLIIYVISFKKGVSPARIILAGVAISSLFGALTNLIRVFFTEDVGSLVGFQVGSLNGVTWKSFLIMLPAFLVALVMILFITRKMNILMLGDEVATTLGLKVEQFRLLLIVVASLLAASSIAVAGMISFVGLIMPHIAKLLVGSDYKYLFPASALLGAILLVLSDLVGRVILPVGELEVGIILAFIGAPFFLILLRKRGRK